jgi:hypothetical protein
MKKLLLLMIVSTLIYSGQAQVLKRLGDRAKQKAEQKAGEKVDKTIDDAVDGNGNKKRKQTTEK